jgi:AsmA-like C-terminal region
VPEILSEPVPQDSSPFSAAPPSPRQRSWFWLPKLVAAVLLFFWLASTGISLLITHTRLQTRITNRLENVFGRPVEVGRYDFSLWGGPTLNAESVTFAEDPRFGHEYFLRAESVTVRLRWQSLLRGHMELGTVSLVRPSLNLVRNAVGDWNLAEWLPHPPVSSFRPTVPGPTQQQPTVRFTRLEVEAGRINFKRSDEKIPFAFTTVNGYIEPDGPGRWRVNLEAIPTRAALALQTPGTLYLSGSLGGTSSRLRPASLDLAWGDASVSDVLRLFRGGDFGVRGNFAIVAHAETQGDVWNLQARSQLRELHRWDLPLHADNSGLDVNARMVLSPLISSLDITDATVEAPASSAHVTAHFGWPDAPAHATPAAAHDTPPKNPNRIEVTESHVSLQDALSWLRAFHPDVASDVAVTGTANSTASLAGWPPRLTAASVIIKSAELASPRLRLPARLSQFHLRYDQGHFTLTPATLSFGAPETDNGAFHFDSLATNREAPAFHVSGNLPQVRNLIAASSALGWNISRGWDLSGPMRCDLRWPAATLPWQAQPAGTIEWGTETANATLLTPFLNQPVLQIRARADLKFDSRHIAVAAADAFGAHWTGAFDRREDGSGWQFAVTADQIAAADLDRWLNPRWRESFIYRVLPFLNPNSPTNSLPENFRASGRLTVDEFTLPPITLHHFHGDLTVGGRHLEISNAKAQLFGGNIDGSLDAELTAAPTYRIATEYSGVDLAALTATSPTLANLFAGEATGDLSLNFTGATPSKMISSLECSGTARLAAPEIHGLSLAETLRDAALRPGTSTFHDADANFTCANTKINFHDLSLTGASVIQGAGVVNFDRTLNLRLWPASAAPVTAAAGKSQPTPARDAVDLTGSLAKPNVRRAERPATSTNQ